MKFILNGYLYCSRICGGPIGEFGTIDHNPRTYEKSLNVLPNCKIYILNII